jgi:mRNA-degrading endonuclease RelE of RelBE toxin-antitoxin system
MRRYAAGKKFRKKLAKAYKKDRTRYEAAMSKMDELLTCGDVNHYKNLKSPLQHLKEVHIDSHFVITFKYLIKDDKIEFIDFDHHDVIFK